jgi:hypothetical protein
LQFLSLDPSCLHLSHFPTSRHILPCAHAGTVQQPPRHSYCTAHAPLTAQSLTRLHSPANVQASQHSKCPETVQQPSRHSPANDLAPRPMQPLHCPCTLTAQALHRLHSPASAQAHNTASAQASQPSQCLGYTAQSVPRLHSPVNAQASQYSKCAGYTAQPVPRPHSPTSAHATQPSQCPGHTAQSMPRLRSPASAQATQPS